MPVDLLTATSNELEGPVSGGYVENKLIRLKRIHRLVEAHQQKQRQAVQMRENAKRGVPKYYKGDEVLVYWPPFSPMILLVRKQRLRYEGPYTVKDVPSANTVVLEGLPLKMGPQINVEYIHLYKRTNNPVLATLRQQDQRDY